MHVAQILVASSQPSFWDLERFPQWALLKATPCDPFFTDKRTSSALFRTVLCSGFSPGNTTIQMILIVGMVLAFIGLLLVFCWAVYRTYHPSRTYGLADRIAVTLQGVTRWWTQASGNTLIYMEKYIYILYIYIIYIYLQLYIYWTSLGMNLKI